ncbi:tetratricopeptide repeat protein [Algoriphagus aestuarii]|nr:tetratricopeptide repeat protein [Algoriphagus aestuarii]
MVKRLLLLCWCICFFTHSQAQENYPTSLEKLENAKNLANTDPEKSFRLVSEVLQNLPDGQDLVKANAQLLQGKLLFQFALYQEASGPLYNAEQIFKESNCLSCLAETHNVLGELYYKIKSADAALTRHEEAKKIYEQLGDKKGLAETMGYIGTMFEKQQHYEEALDYQREALEMVQAAKDIHAFAFVLENIGSIKEDLEEYDSALYFFQKAYELNLMIADSAKILGNLNNLGDTYRKSGQFEKGLDYSQMAMEMSKRLGITYQQRSALVDIAKALELMGQSKEAFRYLEEARQLSDQVFSEETARQLAVREVQYELDKKISQLSEFEQRHQLETQLRWLLSFLILTCIVLAWLMLNRQKIKIRSNKALLTRQAEILLVKEKLIATEKENINLLEARMATEFESHSQALSAQTLHVIEKNQMLGEIQQKLKRILEEEPKEQKKRIRNLIKQIDYNFSQDTDWEDYKNSFEKVHQDFFKNLHKRSKDLTPGEIKLASLMRMNLSSKEIASTLGISPESLRIARYRLRKKLNLEKGENLQQYLLCI